MHLSGLVTVSREVADTRSRNRKTELLAACLRRLAPREVTIGASYLAGDLPQGRIGIGYATVGAVSAAAADEPTLTLVEVDTTFQRVADASGPGSQGEKERLFRGILARATSDEQDFLRRLVLGELRQGALEGVLVEAIAAATDAPASEVRRAVMVAGEVPAVARAALVDGPSALAGFRLTLLRPVQPMLARTAEDLDDAFAQVDEAAVEYKLDGARLQVHRAGNEVRVFTRSLRDITDDVQEIVQVVRGLPVEAVILDGEALGLDRDGRPLAFQDTMRHFGSGNTTNEAGARLRAFFFDCLHLDGDDLLDLAGRERAEALARSVGDDLLIPRTVVSGPGEAREVLAAALDDGHEGVMVKDLDAPYEAGRRGAAWLKVKRTYTLDLVVLAAEWGSGRRRGWLSNLHLGARDPESGGFVMLGKTFKGLTDDTLEWQTEQLLARETGRDGHIVHVRPELVVEIAFDGVQTSPRYPGGLALRFARVRGYRPDRYPQDADTIGAVRAIHAGRAPT